VHSQLLGRTVLAVRQLLARLLREPIPAWTASIGTEVPDKLRSETVYVIGEDGVNWSIAMLCPCNCGATLEMSLHPDGRPRWKIRQHVDGTVSLSPSVWRRVGCKSHFFLKRGAIHWV
jgi:hypothetical protein